MFCQCVLVKKEIAHQRWIIVNSSYGSRFCCFNTHMQKFEHSCKMWNWNVIMKFQCNPVTSFQDASTYKNFNQKLCVKYISNPKNSYWGQYWIIWTFNTNRFTLSLTVWVWCSILHIITLVIANFRLFRSCSYRFKVWCSYIL